MTVASEMNRRAAAPRFVSPWAISRSDVQLSLAEGVCRRRPELADQPCRDGWRQHGFATGRRMDRTHELGARRVLEEIAGRAGLERRDDVAVGVVGREHEHPRRHASLGEGADRVGAAQPRHAQVHQDHVRPSAAGQRQRLGAVRRLADDLEVRIARSMPRRPSRTTGWSSTMRTRIGLTRAGDDAPAAIAGTRAEIAVPPPGSDSIASEPATRATRWRIPDRPKPIRPPARGRSGT